MNKKLRAHIRIHGAAAAYSLLTAWALMPGCGKEKPAVTPFVPTAPSGEPEALSHKLSTTEDRLLAAEARLEAQGDEVRRGRERIAELERDVRRKHMALLNTSEVLNKVSGERDSARAELAQRRQELLRTLDRLQAAETELAELREKMAELSSLIAAYDEELRKRPESSEPDHALIAELELLRIENARLRERNRLHTPDRSNAFSRRAFAAMVHGLTTGELERYIGAPDAVEGSVPKYYVYNRPLTYAVNPAEPDSSVKIRIEGDTATRCFFTE
jgi:hypothetical protein